MSNVKLENKSIKNLTFLQFRCFFAKKLNFFYFGRNFVKFSGIILLSA